MTDAGGAVALGTKLGEQPSWVLLVQLNANHASQAALLSGSQVGDKGVGSSGGSQACPSMSSYFRTWVGCPEDTPDLTAPPPVSPAAAAAAVPPSLSPAPSSSPKERCWLEQWAVSVIGSRTVGKAKAVVHSHLLQQGLGGYTGVAAHAQERESEWEESHCLEPLPLPPPPPHA